MSMFVDTGPRTPNSAVPALSPAEMLCGSSDLHSFTIPKGSLVDFPAELSGIFAKEELRVLRGHLWKEEVHPGNRMLLLPHLTKRLRCLTLHEQVRAAKPFRVLTAYEVLAVAAMQALRGGSPLWKGSVRVEVILPCQTHLPTPDLGLILSYTEGGKVTLGCQYVTLKRPEITALVGYCGSV